MSKKMAKRYEAAWNKLFYEETEWRQKQVINEPHGRVAGELAGSAARLAEEESVPMDMLVSGNANQ